MPRLLLLALSLLAAAAATPACGDNARVAAPPPDAPPDAPPAPRPTLFALDSDLDLAGNLPGDVGQAIDDVIAATDDPDDPTKYLVDHIIAKMAPGTLQDIARAAEPFVTAYVNERLLAASPQLLPRLVAIGRYLGDAARDFGTLDTLQIAPDGTASHAIVGVRVVLDGSVVELGFADHAMPVVATPVGVHASAGQLALDRHALPLSLGRVLRLVLDGAIVPHVDPGAVDLVGVLQGGIDCVALGDAMAEALGVGSAAGYAGACRDAITDIATTIYSELDAVDADPLELDLAGTARAVDRDGDGTIDELADGAWTGTVTYASSPAPLTAGTFTGARVE